MIGSGKASVPFDHGDRGYRVLGELAGQYLKVRPGQIASTDQVDPCVLVDRDSDGRAVGVEVISESPSLPGCGSCIYWRRLDGDHGECQFMPPVVPSAPAEPLEDGYVPGRWPGTLAWERCGAHEPQPGRDG